MPKILAIDSSTDACSAALVTSGEINEKFMLMPKGHAGLILPMINELLDEAGLKLTQLNAVAFGCGPGSFTGIRLAASVVQGLAFAGSLPVIKISSLRVLAQEVLEDLGEQTVLVVQDARMKEVYWGKYVASNGIMEAVCPDSLDEPEVVAKVCSDTFVGVGSGFKIYSGVFDRTGGMRVIDRSYTRAKYVAKLSGFEFMRGNIIRPEEALPVYLRQKVVG